MNSWYMKYALVVLSAMAGFAAYQWVPWCKMGASEWASWVQAIGSIGAIIGAYYVGERQADANLNSAMKVQSIAEEKRQGAYFAIATAAYSYAKDISQYFDEGRVRKLSFLLYYREKQMEALIHSMAAVPVHELGSSDRVLAWVSVQHALAFFERSTNDYLRHINEHDSEENIEIGADGSPAMVSHAASGLAEKYATLVRSMKS